jgi:UDP-galactopyranose mutase
MSSIKWSKQFIADFSALPKDGSTHSVQDICEQHTCQLGCCTTLQGVKIADEKFDRDRDMVTLFTVTIVF